LCGGCQSVVIGRWWLVEGFWLYVVCRGFLDSRGGTAEQRTVTFHQPRRPFNHEPLDQAPITNDTKPPTLFRPSPSPVFESLKATLHDLLNGRVSPADRRAAIYQMKSALVSAKLGVDDLREGVEVTRRKLAAEREQLATVQRRKALAEGINDTETVALAVKYVL